VTEKERHLSGEWTICLMRWGLLACVVLVALLDPLRRLSPSQLALFVVSAALYNLIITLLLYLRLYFRVLPVLTLIADILILTALVHLSGGADSPYFVFAVFPILVATLRFGWHAGLLVVGIFFLSDIFQTALVWDTELASALLFQLGWRTLVYTLVAVVGGLVGERVPTAAMFERRTPGTEDEVVREQLRMVYDLASSLSATLNYERVLDAILDISRLGFAELGMRVGESVGLVLLYDREGWLVPASHRNLVTREDEMRRIRGRKGIVADAISSGEAVIGGPPPNDAELREFESMRPCKSTICVPLRAGFETYGAVLFATVNGNAYTAQHVELLTLYCNQATIALQNASLYQSLREERDKIVGKEEEARRKLARELHDGPTQDVSAIAMRLNFARLLLDRDPKRARGELERLEDLAHRTVKEIRSMLFALRPVILETEGLLAALEQYADILRQNDGLPVEIDAKGYKDCLDVEAQGVVFSILEEAMNNARKHAQASRVWVRLTVKDDLLVAEVIDNGRGFDLDAVEDSYGSRGSLGLINLRERAELIAGTVNIESVRGQGTRVTLVVPISEETARV
jgi:signal transduction histidine kinase